MPERVSAVSAAAPRAGLTGRALRAIGERTGVCFRVVFADGTIYQNRDGAPVATMTFRNAAAERRVWLFGHVGLIESYIDRWLDVDGDLAAAFRAGMDARFDWRSNPLNAIRNYWHEFRFSNDSIAQAKANAEFHYALGTEFYRYWLDDPYMMYTCAYWKEGTTTLEQAQQNKMEHVCRKVQLKPGETFVDIGCGWGGFTFYAWERHKAVGTCINATCEQVAAMRREIARRGLESTLKVIEADFREIPGTYDKVVSIGTLEHAGRDQIPAVVRAHAQCLKPGGIGMLHFIGHLGNHDTEFFIRKHIFPGGWIPGLAETVSAMEEAGLEVLDIENLRRHYAHTLDEWAARFDRHWPDIHALDPVAFDERFRRKWRAYLYSCAEMFRSPNGHTCLFQIAYSRGNVRNYPMSRAHVYT
jgi:cyclopropane-fatty-acyl-phospholipid synthase